MSLIMLPNNFQDLSEENDYLGQLVLHSTSDITKKVIKKEKYYQKDQLFTKRLITVYRFNG